MPLDHRGVAVAAVRARSVALAGFGLDSLVEIGASCPAPSLYLLDSEYETSPDLDAWLKVAAKFVPAVAQ